MPHNVVDSDHCERQDEGNECAQQAIRLSLLGYIINGGTIVAHWSRSPLPADWLLTRGFVTVLLQQAPRALRHCFCKNSGS